MRPYSIIAALIMILLSPGEHTLSLEKNGLIVGQVACFPLVGADSVRLMRPGLSGNPTAHEMKAGFMSHHDSQRAQRAQSALYGEQSPDNRVRMGHPSLRRVPMSQPPIYVIDSAIVDGWGAITRHLYSFTAGGRMTSDLAQRLRGNLWVDSLKHTTTFDTQNNTLSDLYEESVKGQFRVVQGCRHIYTYDANSNMLSDVIENWAGGLGGLWLMLESRAYVYDGNNHMISSLWEKFEWPRGELTRTWRYPCPYDGKGNRLIASSEKTEPQPISSRPHAGSGGAYYLAE